MFHSARLKLTAWYLLIILFISVCFSVVIYEMLVLEVTRFASAQRFRIERRINDCVTTPDNLQICRFPLPNDSDKPDPDLVNDIKQRIFINLLMINGIIVVLAGGLGYFLAGRTLQPIQEMMDEQNRFISDASHELRTPLTALKSAMEVNLRDKHLTIQEARSLIEQNMIDVNKLQLLSDSLLQLSQYQKPVSDLKMEKVSLLPIVEEAIQKVKHLADKKEIKITLNGVDAEVEGNPYSLADLCIIFLDNAIKYSSEKTDIVITIKKVESSVLLTIADHGIGIAAKDTPHIFDRFYRAESSRSQNGPGGYGLGLSIAQRIVKVHHGTIQVKSKIGEGTTFIIRLPARRTDRKKA